MLGQGVTVDVGLPEGGAVDVALGDAVPVGRLVPVATDVPVTVAVRVLVFVGVPVVGRVGVGLGVKPTHAPV